MTTLVVLDQGGSIAISFDDLLKYHGRSSIAGVAHAFKAMERAFPLLSPGVPPERYDITVESGFPGGGARDAFEMVTRAVTGDRYRLASEPAPASYPKSSSSSPAGKARRRPRPFAPSSSRRRWLSDSCACRRTRSMTPTSSDRCAGSSAAWSSDGRLAAGGTCR